MENINQLLKRKYNLHKSSEVDAAVRKTRRLTGEKVPQDPLIRIQNYLDRLDRLINPPSLKGHKGFDRQERNLEVLKRRLYDRFVIKPDEIPESYWENQRRVIRERGQGADLDRVDWEELKRQNTEAIIADQRSSLDKWIDYFASPDSSWVPNALKYYTFRSILNMAEYDKEKKMYPQRSKGTTKPFPDLNREALAHVLDALNKKYRGEKINISSMGTEGQRQFETLLQGENFTKLYAWAIEKITPASEEELAATNGKWVRYSQGSDHMPFVRSLQGYGTGWCTAGESTAQLQLQGGDFYVYYSLDKSGKSTVPRVAIRMEGSRIAEIRGVAPEQNLDTGAVKIVEEKLKEFPDGPSYQKRVADMRHVTEIENKVKEGQSLTTQDLVFLYEIDSQIEGFGYSKDPRIEELRSQRNPEEDMSVVFGCTPDQIAHRVSEIREDTKAYIGPLEKEIFKRLQGIDHVYTSFPEGKVRRATLEIGGKSKQQLERELRQAGINISRYAQDMLSSSDFTTFNNPVNIDIVRLKVQDLGLRGTPTTDKVYARANELGLELCPAEVGPYLRLKDTNQSLGEWYYIGMKQITDRRGYPLVFYLVRRGVGLWLGGEWAGPDAPWGPGLGFVFAFRKENETQNT